LFIRQLFHRFDIVRVDSVVPVVANVLGTFAALRDPYRCGTQTCAGARCLESAFSDHERGEIVHGIHMAGALEILQEVSAKTITHHT
jgi:hypothetical protein